MVKRELAVLVLTEDTGDDAHDTVCAVVEKVLFLLEPGLDRQKLAFGKATERARAGMGFNCYKSASGRDHDKKVDLAQAIARHLLVTDRDAIIFVHIDADGPWSTRDEVHLCANARRFSEEIVRRVAAILEQQQQPHRLDQIALLVPFWTLESWLYQNTREALRLCQDPKYRDDTRHFELWQQSPHLLDEHERPKDTVRFGAKYNLDLASKGFPAGRLHQLGLSFAAAVEAARPRLAPLLAAHTHHA